MKIYFQLILAIMCVLTLPHSGQSRPLDQVGGKYRVIGNNPIYGSFSGTVQIAHHGSSFDFDWNYDKVGAYEGTGHASGKTQIAVEWGLPGQAKAGTVTYTVESNGVLKGDVRMYANAAYRGTETLTPLPRSNIDLVGGRYRVSGMNPIYGPFSGTVRIEREESTFTFNWHYEKVADYDGEGHVSGTNQITVEWGLAGQPRLGTVVYDVASDGKLRGAVTMHSNASYRGSETLTPLR